MRFRPVPAKIQLPPRPQKLLSRPRLLDFLSGHADVKLMAISAAAGYGKTSLLLDHAHRSETPICWYTLDRFDREPGNFFAYLLASVQRQFPNFGPQSETTLASLQNPARDWPSLAATVVTELYESIPEYFTIALDDYHQIENVIPINEFLAYLIQYSDEHCHLIVASRRLPQLPNQALFLARGQMEGLAAEDLQFTAQEIQALVKQNYQLDLPADKATELTEGFEGWITGILLTAQTGWAELLEETIHIQTTGHIYEYLAEQVFAEQTSDIHTFLLDSSTLDRMSAETLDALRGTNDSASMLAQVGSRNLFLIPLDDETRWFRYHQLFRDFLQNRLQRETQERFKALHHRAANLFEARQEWPEAFDHYAQIGAEQEMMRLLEKTAEELFTTGRWDTLQSWIEALTQIVAQAPPLLIYYQGLMLMEQGDSTSALHCFERAGQDFEERGDSIWATWAHVRHATALRVLGRYTEALSTSQKALAEANRLGNGNLVAEAQRTVGLTYYYEGRVERVAPYLDQALQQYQILDQTGNVAKLHHELGVTYRAMGQWRQAVAHYRQASQLWEQLRNLGHWAMTLNSVGLVYHLRGEFAEAYQVLNQALEKAQVASYRRMESVVLSSLGDLFRDVGQYQKAREAFRRSADLADEVGEGFLSVYARQGMGETCRLLAEYEQAAVWLYDALQRAKAHNSLYQIGLCELARGVLWKGLDRLAPAWISLGQAKEFFERTGHLHELARVNFHLADLALQQDRHQDVVRHLDVVAEISEQLGYDSFLVVEGRQTRSLLEYARSLNGDRGWWASVLSRTSQPLPSLTTETKKATPARQPLRIFALGQDRVQYGGEETKTGRPKVRELFFYLLAHRSQGVHREQIMAEFWPEATSSRAALSFKSALYRLRRLYTEVSHEDGRYTLNLPQGSWYDVEAFETLLDEAEATKVDQDRKEAYRQALACYAGDYLETYDSSWCLLERERLRERFRRGLHTLADLCLSQGEHAESQELYRHALAVDEFDEAACRGLMRSYAGAGRRPQALALYHQFAQHLYEEMGITPTPKTEALYQELLREDEDA